MKTRTAIGVVLLILAGASSRADALDFTLHTTSVEEDGFTREQLYVHNDERSDVLLTLPAGWTRTDGPASLVLTSPDIRNSLVRLEKSSLAPNTEFRDAGLDAYRRRAQAEIPQGATGVLRREEHANPLPIFGWKDQEFVFTYDLFGQAYKRSVLFVNLNAREQIVLTCVAPLGDFDAVCNAGFDVLRSWQVVPTR